eukprot:846422-Pleurochrysis_carterae.AAC.1
MAHQQNRGRRLPDYQPSGLTSQHSRRQKSYQFLQVTRPGPVTPPQIPIVDEQKSTGTCDSHPLLPRPPLSSARMCVSPGTVCDTSPCGRAIRALNRPTDVASLPIALSGRQGARGKGPRAKEARRCADAVRRLRWCHRSHTQAERPPDSHRVRCALALESGCTAWEPARAATRFGVQTRATSRALERRSSESAAAVELAEGL